MISMVDKACENCVFLNEDYPPYFCEYGDDNPVICSVKIKKMKEYQKDKLRSCMDG